MKSVCEHLNCSVHLAVRITSPNNIGIAIRFVHCLRLVSSHQRYRIDRYLQSRCRRVAIAVFYSVDEDVSVAGVSRSL